MIFDKIFNNFNNKYNIIVDTGLFEIETTPVGKAKYGEIVVVKRITEIPKYMTNPSILVLFSNGKREYAEQNENKGNAYMWFFKMPKCDVKVVPIIHRIKKI